MAGQLIPRGKNVWLVRVFLGRDPQTGKREYLNHTVHGGKKDAQDYLNRKLVERDKGDIKAGMAASIDHLIDRLLLDYKVNGKCHEWAEQVTRKHLRGPFGKMSPKKLTTHALQRYIADRQAEGAANATINHELALLRRALNLGRKATPPVVTTIPEFPMLEENNIRKGFFEDQQYQALLAALPEYLRPVLAFAYYTGCRKGEILKLRWTQVDLKHKVVRLEPGETKNKEARVIPLVSELHAMLTLQWEIRDSKHPECPWVFFGQTGRQILNFRNAWDRSCKRAGLVDEQGEALPLFHDLRRTGVRNLVRAGVSEAVAMRISGHKTRAVFDRYNITDERDLHEAAAKLGSYIGTHRKAAETEAEKIPHTIGTQDQKRPLQ
ncbi:MAG: site-specific integrase [Bryobacterales bacterium]|nr:site-specific integrase [Bryobacterales bacterium]